MHDRLAIVCIHYLEIAGFFKFTIHCEGRGKPFSRGHYVQMRKGDLRGVVCTTSVDTYNLTYLTTGGVYEYESAAGHQAKITDIQTCRGNGEY